MLEYYGLTELTGAPMTGKTVISMEEAKLYSTLYLTTTPFCIQRYENISKTEKNRIIIKYVKSIDELSYILMSCLDLLICINRIELIIIDSLDHLLMTEVTDYAKVFNISNRLKRINDKYNTNVLVVTTYYDNPKINKSKPGNARLGLGWPYLVNTRYFCSKEGQIRKIRLEWSPFNSFKQWLFEIEKHKINIKKV